MATDDPTYYAKRAQKEREIAKSAANQHVAKLHRQLADEYEKKFAAGGVPVSGQ